MAKKRIPIIIIAFFVFLAAGTALFFLDKPPAVNNFSECSLKYPIMETYPRICAAPNGQIFTEEIAQDGSPSHPIITSPNPLETIYGSSISITGSAPGAWFFEAVFPVLLTNSSGETISSGYVEAKENWMTTDMVPFSGSLSVPNGFSGSAILTLKKDNPSGLPENDAEVEIPISIGESRDTSAILVYFGKYGPDSSMAACTETFGVTRMIPKTQSIGKTAIEELLKGPTVADKSEGYFTSINDSVSLKSLLIKDGVAYAEFDEELERAVGGSCRVAAIRAQITDTLKQFPTVKNVVISINGRTEDILQP